MNEPAHAKALADVFKAASTELARLAGTPGAATAFLCALFNWEVYVMSDSGALVDLMADTGTTASTLLRQLSALSKRLKLRSGEGKRAIYLYQRHPVHKGVPVELDYSQLARPILSTESELYPLACALRWASAEREKGTKRGRKSYPGLSDLVYGLEYAARRNGGKLTFHRKQRVPKGTLIEALNGLRRHLAGTPNLEHLADFIPAPRRHPTHVYEAALKQARHNARTP